MHSAHQHTAAVRGSRAANSRRMANKTVQATADSPTVWMISLVFMRWGSRAVPDLCRSLILPRERLDNRMPAEVPDGSKLNLRSSLLPSGTSDSNGIAVAISVRGNR